MTRKTTVLVVFGGVSSEHEISCLSAASILAQLDSSRYEAVPVGITKEGDWVLDRRPPEVLGDKLGGLPQVDASAPRVALAVGRTGSGELRQVSDGALVATADVVFPVLHGPFGEDGTLQGLLEFANLPYVGCGVFASAACMDKTQMKVLLRGGGLPVGPYEALAPGEDVDEAALRDRLGLPLFVKPARGGSSLGVVKVERWEDLPEAVAVARKYDPKVLVETGIAGREVECAVLEFPDGRVEASVLGEIVVPDAYDFETKYLNNIARLQVPADVSEPLASEIRALAVRAFETMDCSGLARVDFFIAEDGGPIINELNTLPGFTTSSLYPKMWEQTGLDYSKLLDTLIETAFARGVGLR
ncbi:D-alanine--D-alanine ligase family protein [Segniliparus rugosus]|uniref:D-alanine--D-alanine ligase n=1 Tax=Segniliparus rugosus (strain ATCC BAA-974 / DSM 45345 / CCUG 50838 / CIP 108380 / JCM 13579 / CDC 945) TaxID=679197 RepID=E5XMG6_SEGRC|nr:D-alanine--D-alanine ligase family protein [Segniliparus rugosus]EFV14459.1 D-alanine-D-alanine ligase [Segniliparus rugosus ATCC BAA-974]